jgi:hypothetical protein
MFSTITKTENINAYAGIKREIREITTIQQALLILWNPIADLPTRVHLRRSTPERADLVELGDWHRVLDPVKELFVGDNPDCLIGLKERSWLARSKRVEGHVNLFLPFCCVCAQSRKALIIWMVEFRGLTPGYVVYRERKKKKKT